MLQWICICTQKKTQLYATKLAESRFGSNDRKKMENQLRSLGPKSLVSLHIVSSTPRWSPSWISPLISGYLKNLWLNRNQTALKIQNRNLQITRICSTSLVTKCMSITIQPVQPRRPKGGRHALNSAEAPRQDGQNDTQQPLSSSANYWDNGWQFKLYTSLHLVSLIVINCHCFGFLSFFCCVSFKQTRPATCLLGEDPGIKIGMATANGSPPGPKRSNEVMCSCRLKSICAGNRAVFV